MVVGVDSSAASQRAVALAISLASTAQPTELIFCHVIDVPRMLARAEQIGDNYAFGLDAARAAARPLLDACIEAAEKAKLFGRSCIRYGKPASELAATAGAFAADAIVIGNQPIARVLRILNGSVRDEVVRAPRVPVLVAEPDGSDPPELRERCILARPSDSPAAFRLAVEIAGAQDCDLVCISTGQTVRAECRAIERAAVEHQPSLVVISAPPRNTRDLFFPNVVERTLESVRVPVLVVGG